MALKAIDPKETTEVYSNIDKGEPKTVFVIGVLSNKFKLSILANSKKGSEFDADMMIQQSESIFKAGVKAIKNVQTEEGLKDIITIDDKVLEMFTMEVVTEIAGKVMEKNFLTGQEKKN